VLAIRLVFAVAVVALAVVCLRQGLPLGALAVVAGGILLRRSAESGRLRRVLERTAAAS
jgi:hypothetical protein